MILRLPVNSHLHLFIRPNGDPWQGLLAYAGLGGGGGERKAKCQVRVAVSCDRES